MPAGRLPTSKSLATALDLGQKFGELLGRHNRLHNTYIRARRAMNLPVNTVEEAETRQTQLRAAYLALETNRLRIRDQWLTLRAAMAQAVRNKTL